MKDKEKETRRLAKGLEVTMDNIRIDEYLLPKEETLKNAPEGNQPYFEKYGFKISKIFEYLYEKFGCIKSEKYISPSLYMYYITPYLVNLNVSNAYVDKNAYGRYLHDVKQPKALVRNINGLFFDGNYNTINIKKAIDILKNTDQYIIKPSIISGKGRDVTFVRNDGDENKIIQLLDKFGANYIIQEILSQHPDLKMLNPTSLNTARVVTYLPPGTTKHVLIAAIARFGGEGAHADNSCLGGGFVNIGTDGILEDRIRQYRFWGYRSVKEEKGLTDFHFPSYDKMVSFCLDLHQRIPYMGLIGWDIAIDEYGEPVLIELNQYCDNEGIQIAIGGPLFGDMTDDLMEAIKDYETHSPHVVQRSFPKMPFTMYHTYNFEIGKKYSL